MKGCLLICLFLFSGTILASDYTELTTQFKAYQKTQQSVIQQLEQMINQQQQRLNETELKLAQLSVKNSPNIYADSMFNGKLSLSDDGTTVLFKGVNVQIVNGLETTRSINGLGNLIVGYDESEPRRYYPFCADGQYQSQQACEDNGEIWGLTVHKTGSHNIVGGMDNSYTQYGGLVVGEKNVINRAFSVVSGGRVNEASGGHSSVSGGIVNKANARFSSVSGGSNNTANGTYSSISSGGYNIADGDLSAVSGGYRNTANGYGSSIGGGKEKQADYDYEWVGGHYQSNE